MLEYLIQLPFEVLGQSMLGFLELIDIIQWENAAASHESQHFLREILPYCPPIVVKSDESFEWHKTSIHWFNKRRCHVEFVRINIDLMCEVDFEHSVLDNIELYFKTGTSLHHCKPLNDPNLNRRNTSVKIKGKQYPAVIEVLFSLLSSVRSLEIENSNNLSQWIEHIKKLRPCMRELLISYNNTDIKTILEYCPYLEKLSLISEYCESKSSNILQTIASHCPRLRSLNKYLSYHTSAECIADLTAFAEKCPQLEELSLDCEQLTDQSVIALSQHCSRLKKLELLWSHITATSLIALSERGLPLEELSVPMIPIPSAEIAAQCAHALSRICKLNTYRFGVNIDTLLYALQYMTGLRELDLNSSEDHLFVPHLLLLLQGQCCTDLESLTIGSDSSINSQQLSELVALCPQLHTLEISKPTCTSNALLVELARSCPHLQKVAVYSSSEVTEEGVLTLATHCRQLREIDIPNIACTEETVRQLAQSCRHLIQLVTSIIKQGEVRYERYYKKKISALRL